MPVKPAPALYPHLRSSRYAQRERPAQFVPARIRARRLTQDVQQSGISSVIAFLLSADACPA